MNEQIIVAITRRFAQESEVKIGRAAAEVEHRVINFLVVFGVEAVFLQSGYRISRSLGGTFSHGKFFHRRRIRQKCRRKRFFQAAFKASTHFVFDFALIRHGERQNVIQKNMPLLLHVVDEKSQIVRVNFQRINLVVGKVGERRKLRDEFFLVAEHELTLGAAPIFQVREERIKFFGTAARQIVEGGVRNFHVAPMRERSTFAPIICRQKIFDVDELNDRGIFVIGGKIYAVAIRTVADLQRNDLRMLVFVDDDRATGAEVDCDNSG